ncbi:MAG: FAD-dependent oxidoreductase, partial [Bacteroidia bacterium]
MGQGLAGSVLALKLLENGKLVVVIDKADASACSKIAAGIWNPVVFKRLTKSWMTDDVLPELLQFYKAQEHQMNCGLITERAIVKFFTEQQEAELWKKKAEGELQHILDPYIYTQRYNPGIAQTAAGFSKVIQSGNLDVNAFLDRTRERLRASDSYRDELFDHRQLTTGDRITYKNDEAPLIIFAEGHLVRRNPYFNYLPLKPAKGEILTVEMDTLNVEKDIVNKNAFVLPLGSGIYRTGATYNWDDLSD